jgi:hypothetical protein
METREVLYYDPFAPEGQELFDAAESFEKLEARYLAGKVEHDYSADDFVRDVEALQMDAQFIGQMRAIEQISARMHEICGEDHNLQAAVEERARQHDHSQHEQDHTTHSNEEDDKKKKMKDKKKYAGWLRFFSR